MNRLPVRPIDIICAEQVGSLMLGDLPEEPDAQKPDRIPNIDKVVGLHGCNGLVIIDLLTTCRFNPARAVRDPHYGRGFSVTPNPSYVGWDRNRWPGPAKNIDYDPIAVARIYADMASSKDVVEGTVESEFTKMQFIIAFGERALQGVNCRILPGTLPIEDGLEIAPEVLFMEAPDIDTISSIHSVGPAPKAMISLIESGYPISNR